MAWSERETDRNWMFTSRFVPLSLTVNLNSFTRYQKLQCAFMTTADASGRKSYGGCVSWVWIFQLCTTVFIKSQAASHNADKNQCFNVLFSINDVWMNCKHSLQQECLYAYFPHPPLLNAQKYQTWVWYFWALSLHNFASLIVINVFNECRLNYFF